MNDSELDQKLKAACEPKLRAAYQDAFPPQVVANLRSEFVKPAPSRRRWLPRLAWGVATVGCVVIAFVLGHWRGRAEAGASKDVLANAKFVQGTLAMFPNRVRAIVQDERGLNLVLSDQEMIPISTPIYVRICDGTNCSSLVTFSGQQIQIAGQKLTVLSEGDGGIILEGNKFLWSNGKSVYAKDHLKIQAINLGSSAM
jgi:hypothetical protein